MRSHGQILWPGTAQAEGLLFEAPISFWGGICPTSAVVTLAGHPQFGECISNRICVIPEPIGSSSSSAILLELLQKGRAPAGIILGKRDAILPIGVVVAAEMGWPTIPVLLTEVARLRTGQTIKIAEDGEIFAN